jgi:hypothetical protein
MLNATPQAIRLGGIVLFENSHVQDRSGEAGKKRSSGHFGRKLEVIGLKASCAKVL